MGSTRHFNARYYDLMLPGHLKAIGVRQNCAKRILTPMSAIYYATALQVSLQGFRRPHLE